MRSLLLGAFSLQAAYYLQMQPHLFRDAVQAAFAKIKEARRAEAAGADAQQQQQKSPDAAGSGSGSDASDLVLYRRMAEVKRLEQMAAIEDLMYVCILEKFQVGWECRGRSAGRRLCAEVEQQGCWEQQGRVILVAALLRHPPAPPGVCPSGNWCGHAPENGADRGKHLNAACADGWVVRAGGRAGGRVGGRVRKVGGTRWR